MKLVFLLVFIAVIAFSGCKKNDNQNDPITKESVLAYYPLSVGNYWIYQTSNCDSTWTNCNSIRIDSNFVSKDTLINGKLYYKLEGRKIIGNEPFYLRDSLDYIVDINGKIRFSNTDFNSKFNEEYVIPNGDTLYHWYYKMQQDPVIFSVPLGEFLCLDNKLSFFRRNENFTHEFNGHTAFSKGVGIVYENALFASTTGGIKRELVAFDFLISD